MTTQNLLQKSTPAAPETSAPAQSEGGRDVNRSMLRGLDYNQGSQALAPSGGGALKYEGGGGGGGASPVQFEKSNTPPAAAPAPAGPNSYAVEGKGPWGYKQDGTRDPSAKKWGNVSTVGPAWLNQGRGTRQADTKVDEKTGKVAGQTVDMSTISGIPAPDLKALDKIATAKTTGPFGTYAGYDVQGGATAKSSNDWSFGLNTGAKYAGLEKAVGARDGVGLAQQALKIKGPNGAAAAGYSGKAYAGIAGDTGAKSWGQLTGKAEAHALGYVGADARYGIDQKGASAEARAGIGAQVGVTADADYKTAGLNVAGVSTPLTAGVGVHGEATAYAKAGAGAGAYLTKEKIGLWGSAGAAAMAEAKANVHGHVGPVSGTLEAGVAAGAGIGAEGGILFENGKLVIGGRVYAALGYGGSIGGTIVIDLKQSYELGAAILKKARDMGIKGAQAAFRAADADGDGKLSLNDAATHTSNAMNAGAKGFSKGVDRVISALDGDGDGKFNFRKDMGARAEQAGKAISETASNAYKTGKEMVGKAVDATGKAIHGAYKSAHKAADLDGDGKLGLGDLQVGAQRVSDRVSKTIDSAGEAIHQAGKDALAFGEARLQDAQRAVKAAHKMADRTGDGKLGLDDLQQGAQEVGEAIHSGAKRVGEGIDSARKWAGQQANAAGKWMGERAQDAHKAVKSAGKAIHKAADRDGDGKITINDARAGLEQAGKAALETAQAVGQRIDQGYQAAKQAAHDAYKSAHKAADLNGDGKVDMADAKIAAQRARQQASKLYQQAQAKATQMYQAAKQTVKQVQERATAVAKDVHKSLDRTGDGKLGMDDVRLGAQQAYKAAAQRVDQTRKAVVDAGRAVYKSASESLSQAGQTLSTGFNSARQTASAAWGRFTTFMGGG